MSFRKASTTLFVGNLPWTVANRELLDYFSQFGRVSRSKVLFNSNTGMSRGYGFINFKDPRSFEVATAQSSHMLDGNVLNVEINNSY